MLSPVADPCPGLYTSWKWLVYELLPSIPWDSLATANLVVIHNKSISARCSQPDRAGQIATAQRARHQAVHSAVRDLTGNDSASLPLSPAHQWNGPSTAQHHYAWRQKPTLCTGWSENWLRGGDTWPPLCPGRPRAVGVCRRRQLSLARGHTRTNAKGALGHREHPPETGCPSNAFNFPSKLYLGFLPVGQRGKGDVPGSTLWRPCWSERGAGLGFSSHSAQTCRA